MRSLKKMPTLFLPSKQKSEMEQHLEKEGEKKVIQHSFTFSKNASKQRPTSSTNPLEFG